MQNKHGNEVEPGTLEWFVRIRFSKFRGGNKDHSVLGSILGSLVSGNYKIVFLA